MDITQIEQPDPYSIASLEKLHLIFSKREEVFEGDHAKAAAHMLADQQKSSHALLHNTILEILNTYDSTRWIEDLRGGLKEVQNSISASIEEDPLRVKSDMPLLHGEDAEALKSFLGRPRSMTRDRAYLNIAVVLAFYTRFMERSNFDIRLGDVGAFILSLQRGFAICEVFYQSREFGSHIVQQSARLDAQLADAVVRVNNLDLSLAERRTHLEELALNIGEAQANQSALHADLEDLPGKISALETKMMAQLGLRDTDKLWKRQAQFATAAFWLSFALLLAILVGSPFAIYCYRGELLALIASIETAAAAAASRDEAVLATAVIISRLALIGLPVALLIWAIKLIVRFNTRSMLLMDDARHRVAMLNTFLFLLKQEAATIQDRGALLEALFRRTPGHGPETVEPPNLTDLMNYGKEIGSRSGQ